MTGMVNTRTGTFQIDLPIAFINGNSGRGPALDLNIRHPSVGGLSWCDWDLRINHIVSYEGSPKKYDFLLTNGERFEADTFPVELQGLTATKTTIQNKETIQIIYKDGTKEIYTNFHSTTVKNKKAAIYVLTKKYTDTGDSLTIEWKLEAEAIQLHTIKDDTYDLLHTLYVQNHKQEDAPTLKIIKYPNTTDLSFVELNSAQWRLTTKAISSQKTYIIYNKEFLVSEINHPGGLKEIIKYTSDNKVEEHSLITLNGQPTITTQYTYNTEEGTTTATQIHLEKNISTVYHYDNLGQQTKEVRTQGRSILTTESKKRFDSLSNKLECETITTYERDDHSRTESIKTNYDEDGNIVRIEKDGIITDLTYYKGMKTENHTKTEFTYSKGILASIARGLTITFPLTEAASDTLGITRSIAQRDITTQTAFLSDYGQHEYNLPIHIICPENPDLFKVFLESEKTYCYVNNVRKNLKWTFYGYTKVRTPKLPPDKYAIKLSHIGTIHNPLSDDGIKLKSWEGMIIRGIVYYENNDDLYSGRIKRQSKTIIDGNGIPYPLSTRLIEIEYEQVNTVDQYHTRSITTSSSTEITEEGLRINSKQSLSTFTGELLTTEDNNSTKTDYKYDMYGRLTEKTDFVGHSTFSSTTKFTYITSEKSFTVTMETPSGEKYRNEFDSLGRPIKSEYYNLKSESWLRLSNNSYDGVGRIELTQEYDYYPDGRQLRYQSWKIEYDDWGNQYKAHAHDGSEHIFAYDPISRNSAHMIKRSSSYSGYTNHETDSTDGGKNNDEFFYVNGNLAGSRTLFTDVSGQLYKETSSFFPTYHYEYDRFQRLTGVINSDTVITNHYPKHTSAPIAIAAMIHKNGEDINSPYETFGNGILGTRKLDSYDRVVSTNIGGRKQTYSYDGNTQWGKTNDYVNIPTTILPITISYDKKEREFTETLHKEQSTFHSLNGLLLQTTDAFDNSTSYIYDNFDLIKTWSEKLNKTLDYSEDRNLNVETITDKKSGKQIIISYEYDNLGREYSRSFSIRDHLDFKIVRTFDSTGRVTSVEKSTGKTMLSQETYTYTSGGQLEAYFCSGTLYPKDKSEDSITQQTFKYDTRGGLSYYTTFSTNTTAVRTYLHPETDYSQLDSIHLKNHDQMSTEYIASHDNQGRLFRLNNDHLEYNRAGQLIQHLVEGSKAYVYTYDSIGRVAACTGAEYTDNFYYLGDYQYARQGFFLDEGKYTERTSILLNESDSCVLQEQTLRFDTGASSTTNSFELKDADGSLIASYDLSSDEITYFSYTPFGHRKVDYRSRSWLGFKGQPIDLVSGNYHLGNGVRVYNPSIQVFQTPDSLSPFGSGGPHSYSYCNNDPINYSDPSGYSPVRHSYENVSVLHHAYIDRPYVQNVVWGGLGIALALVTGGTSLSWTVAAVGLAIVSAGLSIAAEALEDSDSQLSTYLGWGSFATGLASGGAGLISATRVTEATIARGVGMPPGYMRTIKFNTASRHNNAAVQYELYSGGRQANRLLIDAHGFPRFGKHRFNLPANTEMRFYSRKGQQARANYRLFHAQLAGEGGTHIHAAGAMGVPDYLLTEFGGDTLLRLGIIHDIANLKAEYAQLAKTYGVDILRPIQGEIPLSEVIANLHNNGMRYTYIDGNFCRGSFSPSSPYLFVKAGRKLGLHHL